MSSIEGPEVICCFYCKCELTYIHHYFDPLDAGDKLPVCLECFEIHTETAVMFEAMFKEMVSLGPPC